MQYRALESEVNALDAEVTRLRIMVDRCVESQDTLRASVQTRDDRQQHRTNHTETRRNPPETAHESDPINLGTALTSTRLALPGDPMAVLPAIFSGMDGTARLFKVLIETYPWLLPRDLREAQKELEAQRNDIAEDEAFERKLRRREMRRQEEQDRQAKIYESRKHRNQVRNDTYDFSGRSIEKSYSEDEFERRARRRERRRRRRYRRDLRDSTDNETGEDYPDSHDWRDGEHRNSRRNNNRVETSEQPTNDELSSPSEKETNERKQANTPPPKAEFDRPVGKKAQPPLNEGALSDSNKMIVASPTSSTPQSAIHGILGGRKKNTYVAISRLGRDSEDDEAEEALANTKRSAAPHTGMTPPLVMLESRRTGDHSQGANNSDADSHQSDVNSPPEVSARKGVNPDDTLDF